MIQPRVYLDHNASAPLRSAAREKLIEALELAGNPSSVHAEGRFARRIVDEVRAAIADVLNARPDEIVFTSGATEANNLVMAAGWKSIFLSGVEHDSVAVPAHASGARIVSLPVTEHGRVTVETLAKAVEAQPCALDRALLTLQAANNETGILQDLEPVFSFARAAGITTHTDAVQFAGRLPFDRERAGADLVSISAHKLGGPKGVGALVVRDGLPLRPLLVGGGQQRYRRAGTEAVALIAGFGAALREAASELDRRDQIGALRDSMEETLLQTCPDALIIGQTAARLPNTTAIAVPGYRAETMVIQLDLAGIAVGAGAACSSGKVSQSAVLAAMGLGPHIAGAAIRISLGSSTSPSDVRRFCDAWAAIRHSQSIRHGLHAYRAGGGGTEVGADRTAQGD